MNAETFVASLLARGIRLTPNPPKVTVEPASKLTDQDRETIRAHKAELLTYLRAEQEQAEIDRLAATDGWKPHPGPGHPAYSILETCQSYGVGLRIDPDNGDLMVGNADARAAEPTQPWPSLLMAMEAHLEGVVALIEAGWRLKAGFPKQIEA